MKFIGDALYPLHLVVSSDWKVHDFIADAGNGDEHRREEQRFLERMEGVLGPKAIKVLTRIASELGRDHGGIDFAVAQDGSLLFSKPMPP